MTDTANPTARPPKPTLTSMPSTPGMEVPGGYPRNSVVFASNQWESPASKSKPKRGGFLSATKAYLPAAVAAYLPSESLPATPYPDSPLERPSSVGHTPGLALLHTDSSASTRFSTRAYAGSDSPHSTPTPGDFPTPGGRTFASRSTSYSTGPRDYFGSAAVESERKEGDVSTPAVVEDPAETDLPAETSATVENESEPAPSSAAAIVETPPKLDVLPPTPASPLSATGTSDSDSNPTPGSIPSDLASTPSTAPSSLLSSPPEQDADKPIQSPRPSIHYTPSTADARPVVKKSGSALHRAGSLSSSGVGEDGKQERARFGGAAKRFASLRRRDGVSGSGSGKGHRRGVSLDSSAASSTSADSTSAPSSLSAGAAGTGKPSRRASIMRTIRGEASVLAGRVRGDRERVERGKRIMAGEV
ncbi:hypothetical protein R3P38DRAFT_2760098 [Favolaschia claudopus]|uniref:Uncharacterized protein n=1 Tax=Favolaschia claudopus TaxID=2862362 RepID=A0AAW0E2E2_9AGAR